MKMGSPGTMLGNVIARAVDMHLEGELKAYSERHGLNADEINVDLKAGKPEEIFLTIEPTDRRLIIPRRRFKFRMKMDTV
jgi:hypothetical protein